MNSNNCINLQTTLDLETLLTSNPHGCNLPSISTKLGQSKSLFNRNYFDYFGINIILLFLILNPFQVNATNYYLATNGSNTNNGTSINSPFFTWNYAFNQLIAGDTLFIRGGTYTPSPTIFGTYQCGVIVYNHSGTSGSPITVINYQNEIPILNAQNMTGTNRNFGILLYSSNYWHLIGLTVINTPQISQSGTAFGIANLYGSNCTFERCVSHNNQGIGIITSSNGSGNSVINCDSYFNYDPLSQQPGNNSDGITTQCADTTVTVVLRGNRVWSNSDDGFDCWMAECKLEIDSCWAFGNGQINPYKPIETASIGFKLGITYERVKNQYQREITHCISTYNTTSGYSINASENRMKLYNNISYYNGLYEMYWYDWYGSVYSAYSTFRNNIVIGNGTPWYRSTELTNASIQYNSYDVTYQPLGKVVSTDDFISIDTSELRSARKSNGCLPNISCFHLAESSDLINAGINVGLPYSGAAPDIGAFEYYNNTNQPPVISNQSFQINENSPNGTTVGTVVATDPNAGQTLSYSIISGNTNNAFAINTATGALTVNNSDAFDNNTYSVFDLAPIPNSAINFIGSGSVPLEVGMKFISSVDGFITGFRFYKGPGAQGAHIGNLWSIDGTRLASVTFTDESYSGWQTVLLDVPVFIMANTVYIVSYFSQHGDYVYSDNYFMIDMTNGLLTVPGSTPNQPNGVYSFSTSSSFPQYGYTKRNYWADVLFSPAPPSYPFNLLVNVQDDGPGNLCNQANILINIIGSNSTLPEIASTPKYSVSVGYLYNYKLVVNNGCTDNINLTIEDIPDWLSFRDNGNKTGILEGIPGIDDIGIHWVSLGCQDICNHITYQTFYIEVFPTLSNDFHSEEDDIFQIYPNPISEGTLYIKMNRVLNKEFLLTVSDMSGRVLIRKSFLQKNEISLDVSMLPASNYILNIYSDEVSYSGKFIKH